LVADEDFDCGELVFVEFDGFVFELLDEVVLLELEVPVFDEDVGGLEGCDVAAATDPAAAREAITKLMRRRRGMGCLVHK
jgi:hypothetical protein